MSSLFNQYISNTYTGVLHAGGTAIPSSSKAIIYDGAGNQTDLELGRNGNGVAITGPATISGTLTVEGATTINDNATVTGTFTVGGVTTINDLLDVNGNTTISGNLTVDGSTATINATLDVNGNATVSGSVTIEGTTNINAPLNVEGTATVGDLKAGDLFYPNTTGTPGDVLVMNAAGDAIIRTSPDNIFISGEDNVVTRTTYVTPHLSDPYVFDFPTDESLTSVDISDRVPSTAKAIIGVVMFPGVDIDGEDTSYIIYASRNNSNSNKVIISAAGGGEDNNGQLGSVSQFHSRITNQKIWLSLQRDGQDEVTTNNWRFFVVAWQQ